MFLVQNKKKKISPFQLMFKFKFMVKVLLIKFYLQSIILNVFIFVHKHTSFLNKTKNKKASKNFLDVILHHFYHHLNLYFCHWSI